MFKNKNQIKISICIFSKNPDQDLLILVLKSIKNQTLNHKYFEVILIDNRSKNPIKNILDIKRIWFKNIRIITENNIGYAYCHRRGFLESKGNLILFLADDCILDKKYLVNAIHIMTNNKDVGVLTGNGNFVVNTNIGQFKRILHDSIFHNGNFTGFYKTSNKEKFTPAHRGSAGMVVRKEIGYIYIHYFWIYELIIDRLNRAKIPPFRTSDLDINMIALYSNYNIARSDLLRLTHISNFNELNIYYFFKKCLFIGFFHELFFMRWNWSKYNRSFIFDSVSLVNNYIKNNRNFKIQITNYLYLIGQIRAKYFIYRNLDIVKLIINNFNKNLLKMEEDL